ncbi:MAG: BRO family protein [Gallionella sp.]|nr:BRO family protein [Gallionella sp.]
MNSQSLVFQNTAFDIIDHNNQPWLRVGQIAPALGYTDQRDCTKLYSRHSDEFTEGMTGVVKLTDPNGDLQETRIFSLRGCHLLAMFSRTAIAKEFRKWVLDILDKETQPALPQQIIPAQQNALQQIVAMKSGDSGGLRAYCWSRFNNHFHLGSYKQLPAIHFDEACAYLESMPMKQPAALPDLTSAFLPPDGRYLVSFENGRAGQPLPVPRDACVMTVPDMLKAINEPNGMFVDTKTLFEFVTATVNRLAQRCEYYENKSKGVPVKLAM